MYILALGVFQVIQHRFSKKQNETRFEVTVESEMIVERHRQKERECKPVGESELMIKVIECVDPRAGGDRSPEHRQ